MSNRDVRSSQSVRSVVVLTGLLVASLVAPSSADAQDDSFTPVLQPPTIGTQSLAERVEPVQSIPSDFISSDVHMPPTVEEITDPAASPYHHNPVTWVYLTVRSSADQTISDAQVAITTTAQRAVVSELGLLLKLVIDIQGPGPYSTAQGELVAQEYQSRLGLLTPSGLFLSLPNPAIDALEGNEVPLSQALLADSPAWPLPGTDGCDYQVGSFDLPFGQVRGVLTHCARLTTAMGPATVETVWVDHVGFVYRQVTPLEENPDQTIFRDYLLSGDLTELAPAATDETVTILRPAAP